MCGRSQGSLVREPGSDVNKRTGLKQFFLKLRSLTRQQEVLVYNSRALELPWGCSMITAALGRQKPGVGVGVECLSRNPG